MKVRQTVTLALVNINKDKGTYVYYSVDGIVSSADVIDTLLKLNLHKQTPNNIIKRGKLLIK